MRFFAADFQIKIAVLAAALIAPTLAQAGWTAPEGGTPGVVTAEPEAVAAYLKAHGYKAAKEDWKEDGALIKSGSNGYNWAVFFYGCTKHKGCTSLQFHAGFEAKKKDEPDYKAVNAFNQDKRYAKAYLDKDNDFVIEMDVEMTAGVPEKTFAATLGVWDSLVGDFTKQIGF